MKRYFSILAIVASGVMIAACSSDEKPDETGHEDIYDRYGVARWDNPDDFIVKRYYTLVDTFAVKQPNISVVIKVTPNVDTDVEWVIDGTVYGSSNADDPSNSADELIIKTYYPLVEPTYDYINGSIIEAFVTVGDETIERRAVIEEEAYVRDILSVDFGMDSISVKYELEQSAGVSHFFMRDESTGIDPLLAPHFFTLGNGRTLYIFESNELIEVAEYPGSVWDEDAGDREESTVLSPVFTDFCRRLGFEGVIEITDGRYLASDYEWEREGIIYRIHARDDIFPIDLDGSDNLSGSRTNINGGGKGDYQEDSSDCDNDPTPYRNHSIGISYQKL